MAALQSQPTFELPDCGFFTTGDPMLAATLGTLGFLARGLQPFELYIDAGRLIKLVDEEKGIVNDLAKVRCVFEMGTTHKWLGKINCLQVEAAHKFAKLSQQRETGDLSPRLSANMEIAGDNCRKIKCSTEMLFLVQHSFDMLTNWLVECNVIRELAKDPLLMFSRIIGDHGVAHAVNPLSAEPDAQRRSEKYMRGAAK